MNPTVEFGNGNFYYRNGYIYNGICHFGQNNEKCLQYKNVSGLGDERRRRPLVSFT